jgi:hypothetical protein
VRGYRQELVPLIKKQLLQQLPQLQDMPPKLCTEDGLFWIKDNWWKPHCNVYLLDHRLVSARRRRVRIKPPTDKQSLLNFQGRRERLKDKSLLLMLSKELESHCQEVSKLNSHNRNKEKQK